MKANQGLIAGPVSIELSPVARVSPAEPRRHANDQQPGQLNTPGSVISEGHFLARLLDVAR
jgi:hypothetical protein